MFSYFNYRLLMSIVYAACILNYARMVMWVKPW